jgi:hypothetical protein
MNPTLAKLIYLPAYQNQGTLVDYLDPLIAQWTEDFIMTGLSDSLHQRIIKAGFEEEELEEVVQNQADIKPGSFGFEYDLLKEWTDWIMEDQGRREKVKQNLTDYFYWQGKPWWEDNSEVPWLTGEGMPETPEIALEWFKDIFEISDEVFGTTGEEVE